MAGLIPGLMMGGILMLAIYILARVKKLLPVSLRSPARASKPWAALC